MLVFALVWEQCNTNYIWAMDNLCKSDNKSQENWIVIRIDYSQV
jgi:hypothetical protein